MNGHPEGKKTYENPNQGERVSVMNSLFPSEIVDEK